MASVPTNPSAILARMLQAGFENHAALAKAAGITSRTVWTALQPNSRVAVSTLKKIAKALGLGVDCSLLAAEPDVRSTQPIGLSSMTPRVESTTVLRAGRLHSIVPQDMKLVITSPSISKRLLSCGNKP